MNVTVTQTSQVTRKVTVELPADVVDKTFDRVVKRLAQRVQLPGSYTKLPAKIARIRMMMKKEIQEEVAGVLMDDTAMEAISSQNLEVVGNPVAEESPAAVEHAPYTYSLVVEVAPTFETVEFKGLKVPDVAVEVSNEDVDAALERLVNQHSRLVDANDSAIEAEFYVEVSAQLGDAEARAKHNLKEWEDKYFKINDEAPAALQKALIGFKTGDTLNITASVHDILHFQDHKHEDAEGDVAERYPWEVKVKSVRRWERPAVDDAFAKSARNVDSVLALRGALREEQVGQKDQEAKRTVRQALSEQLAEKNPFDLPSRLVASIYQKRVEEITERMKPYRKSFDPATLQQLEERERTQALFSLLEETRLFFLFKAIAKSENLEVTQEDIQAWAEKVAAQRGVDASFVLGKMDDDQKADLEAHLLDEKLFELLTQHGVKVPHEEYKAERKAKEEEARKKYMEEQAAKAAAMADEESPAAQPEESPAP